MKDTDKIYVAGHQGLVGSTFVRVLKAKGFRNIVTRTLDEFDLRNQSTVERFFAEEKPAVVFLAAAKVGGILANDTYKAEFIYDNLIIASNVIHASHESGVRKLLNLGSSCIYPRLALQPLKENSLLSGPLESTNEPYAIAKIAAIKLCRYYNEQYGTEFLTVMPTNLYGPGDNFNLETSHVLPALIRKFHLAALLERGELEAVLRDLIAWPFGFGITVSKDWSDMEVRKALQDVGISNERVVLWGTGAARREFLHVDDLADACMFIMRNFTWREIGEFINIGCAQDLKVGELAEKVRRIVGFNGIIEYDSKRPDGTPRKLLDVTRLRSLGWTARISLDEGIRGTYEWYKRASEERFAAK
jgi:GDP-L-fucose synthase